MSSLGGPTFKKKILSYMNTKWCRPHEFEDWILRRFFTLVRLLKCGLKVGIRHCFLVWCNTPWFQLITGLVFFWIMNRFSNVSNFLSFNNFSLAAGSASLVADVKMTRAFLSVIYANPSKLSSLSLGFWDF